MALQLLKDGKTFADINSEKPKICFLHGWGGSSSDFSLITNNFESIAIDLPGFGKSKEPESSMNPKEYAEYIINLIPDTVEVLVGHSFGGKVAVHMSFMKNYKNLVLIGSPLIRKTPEVTLNLLFASSPIDSGTITSFSPHINFTFISIFGSNSLKSSFTVFTRESLIMPSAFL